MEHFRQRFQVAGDGRAGAGGAASALRRRLADITYSTVSPRSGGTAIRSRTGSLQGVRRPPRRRFLLVALHFVTGH